MSFGFNDTIGLYDHQNTGAAPAARRRRDGTRSGAIRPRPIELLGNNNPQAHIIKANFVWDLPDVRGGSSAGSRPSAVIANDWQLSGIWTAATGSAYTIGFSYQNGGGNVNLTGSPDYGARVRIVGDTGSGCSGDVYRQFNTAAFQGPLTAGRPRVGQQLHARVLSERARPVARADHRLGGGRAIQLRVDMFNAPNEARITGRNTTMNFVNPSDPGDRHEPAVQTRTAI